MPTPFHPRLAATGMPTNGPPALGEFTGPIEAGVTLFDPDGLHGAALSGTGTPPPFPELPAAATASLPAIPDEDTAKGADSGSAMPDENALQEGLERALLAGGTAKDVPAGEDGDGLADGADSPAHTGDDIAALLRGATGEAALQDGDGLSSFLYASKGEPAARSVGGDDGAAILQDLDLTITFPSDVEGREDPDPEALETLFAGLDQLSHGTVPPWDSEGTEQIPGFGSLAPLPGDFHLFG